MNKKQWHVLGWMFIVIGFMTMVYGSLAHAFQGDPDAFIRIYVYFCMLCVIAMFACFVCGWLEKEAAE